MAGMAGRGWIWLEMAGNCLKELVVAVNVFKWLELLYMALNAGKGLKMSGNG